MLIVSKHEGLLTVGAPYVPHPHPDEAFRLNDKQKEEITRRRAQAHNKVTILPGASEIDDEDWKKITDEKTGIALVRQMVADGTLTPKRSSIKSMSVEEAIAVIKQTGDLSLLKRFREGESRRKVVDAIEAQMKVIGDLLAAAEKENVK